MIKILYIICFSYLLFSCVDTKIAQSKKLYCYPNIGLYHYLSSNAEIDSIGSTSFASTDKQIIANIRCNNLYGNHTLRWEWYSNGLPYLITKPTSLKASENKYSETVSASHSINIRGERAQTLPGDWSVRVLLDDAVLGEKRFKILPEGIETKNTPLIPELTQEPLKVSKTAANSEENERTISTASLPEVQKQLKIVQIIKAPNHMMYLRTMDDDGDLWIGLVDTPFNKTIPKTGNMISYKNARIQKDYNASDIKMTFPRYAFITYGVTISGLNLYND